MECGDTVAFSSIVVVGGVEGMAEAVQQRCKLMHSLPTWLGCMLLVTYCSYSTCGATLTSC